MAMLSIRDMVKGIKERQFTPLEILDKYWARIEKVEDKIKAFISLKPYQELKKEALFLEKNPEGRMTGVPIALKDNINVRGFMTTCSSKVLQNYKPPFDATVAELLKKEGALILGKTNMDEFAFGSSTENSAYQITRNPYDLSCVPGGSSGGSAAVVASGMAPLALGSDTGGSIRQPSAFCGAVGFKPTYGRVSRYGLVAFASSLDQIGPLAKNVEDIWLALSVISGRDEKDPTSSSNPPINYPGKNWQPSVVGFCPDLLEEGVDENIKDSFYEAISIYKGLGVTVKEVHLPHIKYGLSIYYLLASSEASSNLARFDGLRYGQRVKGETYNEMIENTRGIGLGREAKRRILLGTFALSSGYYDAYYLKALKARALIREDFRQVFTEVDLILMPTTPSQPFKIGAKADDPLQMYKADLFTIPVNLAGLPAVSIPLSLKNDLPVGIQLIGRHFEEEQILNAALMLEQERGEFPPPKLPFLCRSETS
ncbi:MAG: Glutamyl-tRNA(Gln) amidotransferase subunit A [candidate division WS2 bacterium]|uniref:Glutamyl-tRNA(Gln) amidotransferase subunit A n=1 Tax=Psychracetigena formicireducens TaxID=2986056 RepID=A0A9E2BKR7_PSYF1|nr:Glutamyl-tRNA(Gln) amidotransferase subunit A [Candidatus Psychracetigena formicireducens]MBT9144879.1 Glutamyl-tRNA(Gln) amidotransferase subunit A [Candidatus Psychracetigena formicireducens]MBT9150398.1 Glutamyl-tRNA(Gln) amidotransferase subunit A [Candidatus Psychracetigena formicireducens]